MVLQLVDEKDVVDLERRLHGAGRNVERADDERDEDQRDAARADEGVQIFPDRDERASLLLRLRARGDEQARDDEQADQPKQLERRHVACESRLGGISIGFALFDARGLPDFLAQIVEARAAHDAALGDFDLIHTRAMDQERLLHTHAVRRAADGERLSEAPALSDRHDALEHLDALLAAFHDLRVDLDGVAGTEIRYVRLELALLNQGNRVAHRSAP